MEVVGVHPLVGHPVARAVIDPDYAEIMGKRPGYHLAFDPRYGGADVVLYPDAIEWRPAAECEFIRVVPSTFWTPTCREFERWEPWPDS